MKIIDRAGTTVEFSAIPVAHCFEYENSQFMRIMEVNCDNGLPINCVALSDGLLYYMNHDALVTPITGIFMVTERGVHIDP